MVLLSKHHDAEEVIVKVAQYAGWAEGDRAVPAFGFAITEPESEAANDGFDFGSAGKCQRWRNNITLNLLLLRFCLIRD
jgi:hypothetical protein